MSSTKFYIYAGRRWRAVDTTSGRVEGWGAAQCQFVSLRRGRLLRVRRGEVLRGLRALASGRPTSVRDGPQLSQIRNTKHVEDKKKDCNDNEHGHHCCRRFNYHCNTDAIFDRLVNQPVTNNVGTTTIPTETIGIQCTIADAPTISIQPNGREIYLTKHDTSAEVLRSAPTKYNKSPKKKVLEKRKRSNGRDKSDKVYKKQVTRRRHHTDVESITSEETAKSQNKEDQPCKELEIAEDEVLLIRSFIEHDDRNIFGVDLERFDSEDFYKHIVFYKLNPLVNIERNREIHDMLNKTNRNNMGIKDFMSHLGLQSLEEASVSSGRYRMRPRPTDRTPQDCESNKENTSKPKPNSREEPNSSVAKKNKSRQVSSSSESEDEVGESTQRVLRKRPSSNSILNNHKANEKRVNKAGVNSSQREPLRRQLLTRSSSGGNKAKERRPAPVEAQVEVNEMVELSSDSDDRESDRSNLLPRRSPVQRRDLRSRVGSERQDVPEDSPSNDRVQKESRPAPPAARGRGGGPRDYSPAEDAALLRLVRAGSRARLVNGNRLWKEMEVEYQRATGIFRSWHSLRNRYLRYVLPALGSSSLPLPPGEAVRLRSDAAQGKLKNRKLQPQYDSLLNHNNKVISAWSRRPRSPPRESPSPLSPSRSLPPPTNGNDPDFSTSWKTFNKIRTNIVNSKSEKRSLRSNATATSTHTPTYSEVTRRYAMKHSTPDSAATPPNPRRQTDERNKTGRRGRPLQASSSDSSARQTRRSNSSRSSSSEEQDSSSAHNGQDERRKSLRSSASAGAGAARPRTRRLFNPNVL